MERDAAEVREGPVALTNCREGEGIEGVLDPLTEGVLFA